MGAEIMKIGDFAKACKTNNVSGTAMPVPMR